MKMRLIEHHEAIGILEGQRVEQNTTDNREQCDVGANAERHDQDRDDGKAGRAAKSAQTEAQIAQQEVKPVAGPGGASLLANESGDAKGSQGSISSFFFRHAAFPL